MKHQFNTYDIIVIGAGHAGCEAAHIAATMGSKVLLITMNMETIAKMSCNPAMGGVAKGQIIREIDALGGMSGIIADQSTLQFRMLNKSKGPAMWSPRAQNDRMVFSQKWRQSLEENPNISFVQDTVRELILTNNEVSGVITNLGQTFYSKAVILTSGTFMNGLIHVGASQMKGGRMGDQASIGITEQLVALGLQSGRMKTGTPPRVDGRSLDYSKMTEQPGDNTSDQFSFRVPRGNNPQLSCYITYTNEHVHDILRDSFAQSPLFNGTITSVGPRYCPSVEDKVNRFAERDRHQIFVEPEGWNTCEIYVNGFSTSLPIEVQYNALRKIQGFENARIFRPGYAIEYDYFIPTQLKETLETKAINRLYFAGQINGTTGYEEAASQGLIAGINAHQQINQKEKVALGRSQAYIGVLIDDLITKGTDEPYRMFTSRAEYRILLRQDNADQRLMPIAQKIGTINTQTIDQLAQKISDIERLKSNIQKLKLEPSEINSVLSEKDTPTINETTRLDKILLRPQINIDDLSGIASVKNILANVSDISKEQVEILLKYEHYITKEQDMVDKIHKYENVVIPPTLIYANIHSLSIEARQKLEAIKPETLGQATRISGVSPADISILLTHFTK